MVNTNKKAISPVVATALLLVVAVVAVVGFQAWFDGFSSEKFADTEEKSNAGVEIQIQRLEVNGGSANVWVKNSKSANLNVTTVGSQITTSTGAAITNCALGTAKEVPGSSLGNVSFASCSLTANTKYKIVLTTDGGVYQGEFIAK